MKRFLLLSAPLVLCFLQSTSKATSLLVSASNVFLMNCPVTTYTAPGATWSVSFTVDSAPQIMLQSSGGFDVTFDDFIYSVNNNPVAVTPAQIRFFANGYGGMLDIDFVSNSDPDMDPITGISFSGPAMFTGSTSSPNLVTDVYTASSNAFWWSGAPIVVTDSSVVTVNTVPEPDTLYSVIGAAICFLASRIMHRISKRRQ